MKRARDHRLIISLATSFAIFILALPSTASSTSLARHTTAGPCTTAGFDRAAGKQTAAGFTRVECAEGWGLAAGPHGSSGAVGIFRRGRAGWTEVQDIGPNSAEGVGPLAFAGLGVKPALLRQLARPFALSVRQLAYAGALVGQLAGHETRLKAPGSYQASPVLSVAGRTWFVTAGAASATSPSANVNASPYPDGVMRIYRWSTGNWSQQGTVQGWMGPIGGCCGITAVSLTSSASPDFAITGGGAGDTNWLAVVSAVGGHWHLVPFDYGYGDSTVVNGTTTGHGVSTEVDASSAAGGPTTVLFEKYKAGAFRPAVPSGPSPPCSLPALQAAAGPGQFAVLLLNKFACADGWAMAIGTGAGFTGQVIGLFEADGSKWGTVSLDNGDSLGSAPGIYDIPLSLLDQLAQGLGPTVRPALATAPLIAVRAMTGWPYLNGVITADGALWYVAEAPTGSAAAPNANARVYRWSGSAWVKKGVVERVPASLNYFRASSGGWFEAVDVPGTSVPSFIMQNATSASQELLTDYGGAWHAAPYSPPK